MPNYWGPTNNVDTVDPASENYYLGAAFRHQTPTGTLVTDPTDNRVEYVAGEDTFPVEQVTRLLGGDVPSVGVQSTDFGTGVTGTTFPRLYDEDTDPALNPSYEDLTSGAGFQPNAVKGNWYSSLRPNAGYPLPIPVDGSPSSVYSDVGDVEYAAMTDETEPMVRREIPPLTYTDRTLQLPDRRVKDIPDKEARSPASINDERPWDIIMGAWPWTGQKSGMQQPVASLPRFYAEGIPDAIPSPAGTGPTVPNTVNLTPYPLTWRLAASPFDTEQAGYMDAGTAAYSG